MLTSLDIDSLKGVSRSQVKTHFYRLWTVLSMQQNFWEAIRNYCLEYNEPATYLAVMLTGQLLTRKPTIRPEIHNPAIAWASVERRLSALGVIEDRTKFTTDSLLHTPEAIEKAS